MAENRDQQKTAPPPSPAVDPLDELLNVMLSGVHPEYLPLIDKSRLKKVVAAIKTPAEKWSPPPGAVFEWLRYAGPREVVGVVCGQDPYPDGAQGLCFSKDRSLPVPASFRNVAKCLRKQFGFDLPHADLRYWAVQGLLMPNNVLTTELGSSLAHADAWAGFVADLVKKIASGSPRPLFFMLWGGYAVKHLKPVALQSARGHAVLEWSHPSPAGDNRLPPAKKFENCDSFALADEFVKNLDASRKLHWNTAPTVLTFADGACSGNGTARAVGGFGVLVVGGAFGATRLHGRVPAEVAGAFVAPTNNRAELSGLCWAMRALLAGCATGRVIILSDSKIYVNLLAGGLAKHRAKNTEGGLANPDLLETAWDLLQRLKAQTAACEFRHVPASHDVKLGKDATPLRRLIWKGNAAVDELAKKAVAENPGAPYVLDTKLPGLAHRLSLL